MERIFSRDKQTVLWLVTRLCDCYDNMSIESEGGGSLKDPRFLFLLHVVRRRYKEAAETSVITANREQLNRKYKPVCHLLFCMY
uniref:Uncharacterized protein n=1 Tax=Glossina palpalis gambiensis TaxID=67801 RepID=A0A1B0BD60_9MUSC